MIEIWWHQHGEEIHTHCFALFLSFCWSEIQVSRKHMLWGPHFHSCLSNLLWILRIIETNESCFIFSFFYSLIVSDIAYNTKDTTNVNFYKYEVSSILENEVHCNAY